MTDSQGSSDSRLLPRRGKAQLTVFSGDASLDGTFVWDEKEDLTNLRLRIDRVARFRAAIRCNELGRREVPATAYLQSFDGRRLGGFKADLGKIGAYGPGTAGYICMTREGRT